MGIWIEKDRMKRYSWINIGAQKLEDREKIYVLPCDQFWAMSHFSNPWSQLSLRSQPGSLHLRIWHKRTINNFMNWCHVLIRTLLSSLQPTSKRIEWRFTTSLTDLSSLSITSTWLLIRSFHKMWTKVLTVEKKHNPLAYKCLTESNTIHSLTD